MNMTSQFVVLNLPAVDPAPSGQGSAVGVPGATAAPLPAATSTASSPVAGTVAPGGNQVLPAQQAPGFGLTQMIIIMVGMAAVIGFSMWSQSRQNKQRQAVISAVKKGDKVTTTSGIIGMVVELTDDEMVLAVETGRVRFLRSALAGVVRTSKDLADSKIEAKPNEVKV